jgi:hypothetical protein
MERNSGALLRFLYSCALGGAVMTLAAVCSASGQGPCGLGRGMSRCKTADTAAPVVLRSDPSFEIGESLADALVHKCSFFRGVVASAESRAETGLTRVRLQTGDWLLDDIADSEGVREFDLDPMGPSGRLLNDGDLATGHELIVGECFNWSDIRFVLGKEKYFASVLSTIDFHEANDLQQNFAALQAPLKAQNDKVFGGYATECALRVATADKLTEKVKVFGALMTDPDLPNEALPRIGFGMLMMLYKYGSRLSVKDHDDILQKLFDLTNDANRERATTAILVLARLSGDETLQFDRYVDRSSSRKLASTIRAGDFQDDSVARLERRLEKIN